MMRVRLLTAAAICFLVATLVPAPASAQSEVVEYYALDAIGSVRVVFDASGAIKSRRDYAPFGEEISSIATNPKVYAGLFRDDESTLDYAEARMYQSNSGRFTAVDPVYAGLFNPQGWNRYAYALNSPLSYTDTTGLDPCGIGKFCVTIEGDLPSGFGGGGADLMYALYDSKAIGLAEIEGQLPIAPAPPQIFLPDPPVLPPTVVQEAKEDCQVVPSAPRAVSVNDNMAVAQTVRNDPDISAIGRLKWFYNQVRNRGPWDYKQHGRQYQAFGNFNFGATGAATGISPSILQRGAGFAQWMSGNGGQGSLLGTQAPFGDDWPDNINIRRGIAYYQQQHEGRPCK